MKSSPVRGGMFDSFVKNARIGPNGPIFMPVLTDL